MALTKSHGLGRDGVGHVYTSIRSKSVAAEQLRTELESVLGAEMSSGKQVWHLTTAELAYSAGAIVQVRLADGEAPLTSAKEAALENAITQHKT